MRNLPSITRSALLIIALLIPGAARANALSLEIKGVFDSTQVFDPFNRNAFQALQDQPYTLIVTYDPSVPDTGGVLNSGEWEHTDPQQRFVLSVAGVTFTGNGNYLYEANGSSFSLSLDAVVQVDGIPVPPGLTLAASNFDFDLLETDVAFLNSGGPSVLPDTPFFLNPVDASMNILFISPPPNDLQAQASTSDVLAGSVDSIRIIPEPTSLALLGLGGLAFTRRRRGRRRAW